MKEAKLLKVTPLKKHILSHQHLHSTFYELKTEKAPKLKDFVRVKRGDLETIALPQLIVKYLQY